MKGLYLQGLEADHGGTGGRIRAVHVDRNLGVGQLRLLHAVALTCRLEQRQIAGIAVATARRRRRLSGTKITVARLGWKFISCSQVKSCVIRLTRLLNGCLRE